MKKEFINSVKSFEGESYDLDFKTIGKLPNCYAKGYLTAKYEKLTDSTDDLEEKKEALLEWAEYNIWK